MQRRIFFALAILCLSCAKETSQGDRQPITHEQKLNDLRRETWVSLKGQSTLLVEDMNVLGMRDATDPEFCFRLGHLLGKAAAIGSQTEKVIPSWNLTSEQYERILAPAQRIQIVSTRPGDKPCGSIDPASFDASIRTLDSAIEDAKQQNL